MATATPTEAPARGPTAMAAMTATPSCTTMASCRLAGPQASKRRWKAWSAAGVVMRTESSTARPRSRPNSVTVASAAAGLAVSAASTTTRYTAAVMM